MYTETVSGISHILNALFRALSKFHAEFVLKNVPGWLSAEDQSMEANATGILWAGGNNFMSYSFDLNRSLTYFHDCLKYFITVFTEWKFLCDVSKQTWKQKQIIFFFSWSVFRNILKMVTPNWNEILFSCVHNCILITKARLQRSILDAIVKIKLRNIF